MGDTMNGLSVGSAGSVLGEDGFVILEGMHGSADDAWVAAWEVIDVAASRDALCARIGSTLRRVGEFVIPPRGAPQRDFQALHLDFGVPSGIREPLQVARYTALFVDPRVTASGAQTRLVPLGRLASQRKWPELDLLRARVASRLVSNGPEGIFGRLIEAVDATSELPSKDGEGFLCGLEFATLAQEEFFFAEHGLDLSVAEMRVTIEPAQVMVFDNLRCAHGRVGKRNPGELHQLCVGYNDLPTTGQRLTLDAFLGTLTTAARSPSLA